jgi:hypothetical protein
MHLKKNTILVIIIVVAFGAAGVILYRGLFSGPKTQPGGPASISVTTPDTATVVAGDTTAPSAGVSATPGSILPYGIRLDFASIKKYNADGKLFSYPVVTPPEVGPELGQIIKAPAPTP